MVNRSKISVLLIVIIACFFANSMLSCSEIKPTPKKRVLEFVNLIQKDSLPDIFAYLDIQTLAIEEYSNSKDSSLSLEDKKKLLVDSFMRNGKYRKMYLNSQIVVNKEEYFSDTTAAVEVSYIDRKTRIQYYTHMGLKFRYGNWFITSMKLD